MWISPLGFAEVQPLGLEVMSWLATVEQGLPVKRQLGGANETVNRM